MGGDLGPFALPDPLPALVAEVADEPDPPRDGDHRDAHQRERDGDQRGPDGGEVELSDGEDAQPADDQDDPAEDPPERAARRTDDPDGSAAPAGPAGVVGLAPDERGTDGHDADRSDHPADPMAESQRGGPDQQGHPDGGDADRLPALGRAGL